MNRALVALGIAILVPAGSIDAQVSPAASVYRSQYGELRTKATGLLDRSRASRTDKLALREELFALTKLVHRLQEEAGRDNVEQLKRGQTSDKTLLLVAQGCGALDFFLTAIDNHFETGDLAFLQLARQAIGLMDAIEQFF